MKLTIEKLIEMRVEGFLNELKKHNLQIQLIEKDDRTNFNCLNNIIDALNKNIPNTFSIFEVSEKLGIKSAEINFWCTSFGKILDIDYVNKTNAFTEKDIKILSLIKYLKVDKNYSLDNIKKFLE